MPPPRRTSAAAAIIRKARVPAFASGISRGGGGGGAEETTPVGRGGATRAGRELGGGAKGFAVRTGGRGGAAGWIALAPTANAWLQLGQRNRWPTAGASSVQPAAPPRP